jgi:hypothetical protein
MKNLSSWISPIYRDDPLKLVIRLSVLIITAIPWFLMDMAVLYLMVIMLHVSSMSDQLEYLEKKYQQKQPTTTDGTQPPAA